MSRALRTGPVRRYKDLEFYAFDGMVVLQDRSDGFRTLLSPAVFAERALAVRNMITANAASAYERDFNAIATLGVENMEKCVVEAKAMGDPTDPQVRSWYSRHNTRNRRKQVFTK